MTDDDDGKLFEEHVEGGIPDDGDDVEVESLPSSMAVDAVASWR